MGQLRRYLWPIAIGGAVLVIALIAVSAYIIPEGHKVSQANASKVTLQAQQASLQDEIAGLEHESREEPKNCAALRQDLTLVPATPTVDLFLHQISQLATNSVRRRQASRSQARVRQVPVLRQKALTPWG